MGRFRRRLSIFIRLLFGAFAQPLFYRPRFCPFDQYDSVGYTRCPYRFDVALDF